MTEINNNIPNFGFKTGQTDRKKIKDNTPVQNNVQPEAEKENKEVIRDTGTLGLSQVMRSKGGNITKSVDEAVMLAQKNPDLMLCADKIFDNMYDKFIKEGKDETTAYMNAIEARNEFMEIATGIA